MTSKQQAISAFLGQPVGPRNHHVVARWLDMDGMLHFLWAAAAGGPFATRTQPMAHRDAGQVVDCSSRDNWIL